MSQILDRQPLTDLLITTARTVNFPIGDAGPPELPADDTLPHAGWNGQPNAPGSFYVPYGVITPAPISTTSGPFSDPQGDAQVPFTLATYGVNRGQVEMLAGRLRTALAGLRNELFNSGDSTYKIQQVWFNVMGGVARVEASDPPTYGEVDTLTVWTTK